MGYTHYWRRERGLPHSVWENFKLQVGVILSNAEIPIGDGFGEKEDAWIVTDEVISFNGIGDDSHETFYFRRNLNMTDDLDEKLADEQKAISGKRLYFAFCKTANKPYDSTVTAVLIAAKHFFGDAIIVTSDGENAEWNEGRAICQKFFGYGEKFKLDKDA